MTNNYSLFCEIFAIISSAIQLKSVNLSFPESRLNKNALWLAPDALNLLPFCFLKSCSQIMISAEKKVKLEGKFVQYQARKPFLLILGTPKLFNFELLPPPPPPLKNNKKAWTSLSPPIPNAKAWTPFYQIPLLSFYFHMYFDICLETIIILVIFKQSKLF